MRKAHKIFAFIALKVTLEAKNYDTTTAGGWHKSLQLFSYAGKLFILNTQPCTMTAWSAFGGGGVEGGGRGVTFLHIAEVVFVSFL